MSTTKTMTLCITEPPYESAASTTAMRMIGAALRQGVNVKVFAFEGAINLTMKEQKPLIAETAHIDRIVETLGKVLRE